MHQGELAARLGLSGIPAAAEAIFVRRDLALAELTGGRLLLDMLSTAQALAPLQRAKARGVKAVASVNVHQLVLNENDVDGYRTFAKLSPPLRSEDDRRALVDAVREGVIDVIVSGHDPRPAEDKRLPFAEAAFGAVGLETLLAGALTLHHKGDVPLNTLIAAMTLQAGGNPQSAARTPRQGRAGRPDRGRSWRAVQARFRQAALEIQQFAVRRKDAARHGETHVRRRTQRVSGLREAQ